MLTPPRDLPEKTLSAAVSRCWGLDIRSMHYRAVGFGSHHWEVTDAGSGRWFLTVDELENKRYSRADSLESAFERLRAALTTARNLHDFGLAFVVPPVPSSSGVVSVRLRDRFAVAVYPFVDAQTFTWGEFTGPAHREAVLAMIVGVHTVAGTARRHAMADDFAIPYRDELRASLDGAAGDADTGPYGRRVARLLDRYAVPIERLLGRYDRLVARCRALPSRSVLTHGEPHPGNTMLASDGWRLVDWDTTLVAPPERDLWALDPGDGSVLARYAQATGLTPHPLLLQMYRLRWDLADIALEVGRFRRPHTGSVEDDKAWDVLRDLVESLGAR